MKKVILCILLLTVTAHAKVVKGTIEAQPWNPGDGVSFIEEDSNVLKVSFEEDIAGRSCSIIEFSGTVDYKADCQPRGSEAYVYFRKWTEIDLKNFVSPYEIPDGVKITIQLSDSAPRVATSTKSEPAKRVYKEKTHNKY